MIVVGILLFALLIVVHEYGHFIVARRNGVEVEEFGIGFPPRLLAKRLGETVYSLNLLPLGGFVKLKGESDSDRRPGSFGSSSYFSKLKILLAGVGMNLVAAFAIILVLALTQLPTLIEGQFQVPINQTVTGEAVRVAQVAADSAADSAGILSGAEILQVADTEITSSQQLSTVTESYSGQEVLITYRQHGEVYAEQVTMGDGAETGYLGVVPVDIATSRYTWAAPLVALGVTGQMVWLVLTALTEILSGLITGAGRAAVDGVAGPVGIVFLLQNLGDFGIAYLLFLIASISVSLAVFNALPIPALDGGRLAVISVAHGLKKRLDERVENTIHSLGFLVLIVALILITYVDIQRFF